MLSIRNNVLDSNRNKHDRVYIAGIPNDLHNWMHDHKAPEPIETQRLRQNYDFSTKTLRQKGRMNGQTTWLKDLWKISDAFRQHISFEDSVLRFFIKKKKFAFLISVQHFNESLNYSSIRAVLLLDSKWTCKLDENVGTLKINAVLDYRQLKERFQKRPLFIKLGVVLLFQKGKEEVTLKFWFGLKMV